MDSKTGNLYPSIPAALLAGVALSDIVELSGQPKAINRVKIRVKMASRHINARRKALRRQQKASRKANRKER